MSNEVFLDERGYLRFKKKPNGLVHRKVCRDAHGPFPRHWDVHHIDGNKLNNAPENLIAVAPGLHQSLHRCHRPPTALPARDMIQDVQKQGGPPKWPR